MKLLMAITSSDDSRNVLDRLTKAGFRSTVVSSTGGFLREGNTTMLIGTEDERVGQAIEVIRQNCRRRSQWVAPMPPLPGQGIETGEPVQITVGGAVIFVLEVAQFVQV